MPFKISQAKKDKGQHCCAYGCTNKPVKKKGGFCHKHYARLQKERDLVYDRYNKFLYKSKARGIENSVTLEEFRKFCHNNRYIADIDGNRFKGRRGQNATVDRRCNTHGYHLWNMTILSNRENARKGNRFSGNNFEGPNEFDWDVIQDSNEEIPF